MTGKAARVAAKLTKAQREMFLKAEPYGSLVLIRWPEGRRPDGWRERDLSLYWNANFDSLTPLGLAVRAHLETRNEP